MELFNSWPLIGAALAIGLAGGLIRGISGFGVALVMVPALALLLPTQVAVATVVLTSVITNVPVSYSVRREADWRTIAWVGAGASFGIAPGLWVLSTLSSDVLRQVVGVVVLGTVALLAVVKPRHASWSPPWRVGIGLSSGVIHGATGLGGVPVVLYFLSTSATPQTSRASFIGYLTVVQLMQLAGLLLAGLMVMTALEWTLFIVPAMLAGQYAGSAIFRAGGHLHFRTISLAILAGTGLAALLR